MLGVMILADITRIKNLRIDNDLTQQELAKHLNINSRSYAYYENGDRSIPLDLLISIANYYDVSIDYLVRRTDKKQINK